MNLIRSRDLWSTSVIPRLLTASFSVLPDLPLVKTASALRMSSEMTMVIFPASTLLHNNLLTTQRELFVTAPLVGLYLSMLCAMLLKLKLLAMTNFRSKRTLTNALSNSKLFTMLDVVKSKHLDNWTQSHGSSVLSWLLLVLLFATLDTKLWSNCTFLSWLFSCLSFLQFCFLRSANSRTLRQIARLFFYLLFASLLPSLLLYFLPAFLR